MKIFSEKDQEKNINSSDSQSVQNKSSSTFVNNRPDAIAQRRMSDVIKNSPQVEKAAQMHATINAGAQNRAVQKKAAPGQEGTPSKMEDSFEMETSIKRTAIEGEGAGEEGEEGHEVSFPDFFLPEMLSSSEDPVRSRVGYSGPITKQGPVPAGYGVTNAGGSIVNLRVRKRRRDFLIRYTFKVTIDWQSRSGTGPAGEVNIASNRSAGITAANYGQVVTDLTPNMGDLNGRPPRANFWSESLTNRHERFHAGEYRTFGRQGSTMARNWLNAQAATTVAGCNALAQTSLLRGWQAITAGMTYPSKEERAYGDGAPSYRRLANSVKRRGDAGRYT